MRLRYKMILLFLAVSLVPLTGAVLLVLHVSERSITRQVHDAHDRIGRTSAALAMDYLRTGVVKLETVSLFLGKEVESGATYIAKGKNDQVVLTNRLNDLVNPQEVFNDLQYWNAGENPKQEVAVSQQADYNGQFALNALPQQAYQQKIDIGQWLQNRAAANTNLEQMNVQYEPTPVQGNSEALHEANKGNSCIGTLEQTKQGPTVVVSAPLRVHGDIYGVLLGHMNLAPLQPLLASAAGEGRSVTLCDGSGAVIATSGELGGDAMEETTLPAGYRDWTVAVREPRNTVYAPLAEVRTQAWIWLGVGATLALLLALLVSAHLVKPISTLTLAAESMRRGELSVRSAVRRGDELGRLASAFDEMAESLQALDRAKNEFLSHVSHELRTPLTSMQLSVVNLLDGTVGAPSEVQARALTRIRADVERLIRMVNELLDIARIEAGGVTLRKADVDLSQVARDCVERLDAMARQRGVTLAFEGNGPAGRSCDAERLQQVILNLIDNAVKFTPSGGRVTVAVQGGRIAVRDTGIGIPGEQLDKVFEPFHQVPQPDGTKHAGAGLGLAIARKLVQLHGGTLRASSEPGRGSEFTVELP